MLQTERKELHKNDEPKRKVEGYQNWDMDMEYHVLSASEIESCFTTETFVESFLSLWRKVKAFTYLSISHSNFGGANLITQNQCLTSKKKNAKTFLQLQLTRRKR